MKVKLENVGPHEHLQIAFTPGVNVLVGKNGAGKSTAAAAAARALGGKDVVESRDGTPGGAVYVNGACLLRVGKRTTRTGAPTVELGNSSAIGDLIDPGLDDPEKADAARVRAVLQLVDIPEAVVVAAFGESGDVVSASASARKRLHQQARDLEAQAAAAAANAAAAERLAATLKAKIPANLATPLGFETTPPALLREKAVQARSEVWRLEVLANARRAQEDQVQRLQGTIVPPPDLDVLEARLATATAATLAALRTEEEIHAARDAARDAVAEWTRIRAILDTPVEGPTREDVIAAASGAATQELLADASALLAEYNEITAAAAENANQAQEARRGADQARAAADDIPEKLGAILSKHAGVDLRMNAGRLYARQDGEWRLFHERLSDGQRARIALRVGLLAYPGRVIPLPGARWASIQPSERLALAREAKEQHVFVVTEEPTDDEGVTVRWLP